MRETKFLVGTMFKNKEEVAIPISDVEAVETVGVDGLTMVRVAIAHGWRDSHDFVDLMHYTGSLAQWIRNHTVTL